MSDGSFIDILLTDVNSAVRRHERTGSQSDKRDLVRTAFAAFEGVAWIFREHIVLTADSTYGLESEERAVLDEEVHFVDASGRIQTQSKFLPLLSMVRLTARIGERIAPDSRIDFSGPEWEKAKHAVAIRNRITHPKANSDLDLSDDDLEMCLNALFWMLEVTASAMDAANVAMIDYLGEFHDVLDRLKSGDQEISALYKRVREQVPGTG